MDLFAAAIADNIDDWEAEARQQPQPLDVDVLADLRKLGPPDTHCASDCCDAYPRLHVHGDHDEWNDLLARLSSDPARPSPAEDG